jgi:hypothetical protein
MFNMKYRVKKITEEINMRGDMRSHYVPQYRKKWWHSWTSHDGYKGHLITSLKDAEDLIDGWKKSDKKVVTKTKIEILKY